MGLEAQGRVLYGLSTARSSAAKCHGVLVDPKLFLWPPWYWPPICNPCKPTITPFCSTYPFKEVGTHQNSLGTLMNEPLQDRGPKKVRAHAGKNKLGSNMDAN